MKRWRHAVHCLRYCKIHMDQSFQCPSLLFLKATVLQTTKSVTVAVAYCSINLLADSA